MIVFTSGVRNEGGSLIHPNRLLFFPLPFATGSPTGIGVIDERHVSRILGNKENRVYIT